MMIINIEIIVLILNNNSKLDHNKLSGIIYRILK